MASTRECAARASGYRGGGAAGVPRAWGYGWVKIVALNDFLNTPYYIKKLKSEVKNQQTKKKNMA